MIYIQACRVSYQKRELDDVGWVKATKNLAYGLTNLKKAYLIHTTLPLIQRKKIADQCVL